jgi:hypothetical protein
MERETTGGTHLAQFRVGAALRRGVSSSVVFAAFTLAMLYAIGVAAAPATFHNGGYAFTVAPPAPWIQPRDVAESWDALVPGSSGASWRNWLFDVQIDRRGGARERYYDTAYEPVSSEQVQNAGKHEIWFSPDYERLTIHRVDVRRDGVWKSRLVPASITLARRESDFERDMATGAVSALIVLDDVRSGDVVRVSYTIGGINPVLGGFVDEDLHFGYSDPLLENHARILFDADAKIAEHVDPGAPSSTQKRDRKQLEWHADQHGLAGIVNEGRYPIWFPAVPRVVVGIEHDWSAIAAWARSLYPVPQPLPDDLERKIAEWNGLPSQDERIAAALRAVQEEVRYFGTETGENSHRPAEPADTWSRRYGDCKDKARLLATVLNRLGVDARPALVSAGDGKYVEKLPPAASVFDHVVVEARLADATLWLDATQTQQRGSPRRMVPGDFGFALPVAPDVRELIAVKAPDSAVDRVRIHARVGSPAAGADGVELDIESVFEGAAADRMRYFLTVDGEAEVSRKMREFCASRYGRIASADKVGFNDDEAADRFVVKERYTLTNPWVAGDVGQRLIDADSDGIGGYIRLPKTNERHAPLSVAFPVDVEQTFEVAVPAGWHALSTPMQRSIGDSAVEFDYRTDVSAQSVTATQRYRARRDVVEAAEFPRHLAVLREANELAGRRIAMGVSTRDASRERDRRLEDVMRHVLDDSSNAPGKAGGR